MAKRFTDTEKWKNPWFRDMDNVYRWLWVYILDNCDAAGIWRLDFALAGYCIGEYVNSRLAAEQFEDKIIQLDHDKWFIPSFVTFQYGELSEASRPHQSVIKILTKNGIDPKKLTLSEGYQKGIQTLKEQDKEQDKAKDSLEKGIGEKPFKPDLDSIYKLYPRKEGKARGLVILKGSIKSQSDLDDCLRALDAFVAHHKKKGTEANFLPQFKTWAGSWRDALDSDYGESQSFKSDFKTEMLELLKESDLGS